jgi:hypothetical protein
VTPSPRRADPPTRVLLGKGGSGRGAWEAWIEQNIGPIQGNNGSAGFMLRFPQATPRPAFHWEQLEPWVIRHGGVYTRRDCLSWLPGSGLLLWGVAREDVASVRIELAGRPPVEVATFGRDQPVPWVAFVSPPLPADTRLDRVVVVALWTPPARRSAPSSAPLACPGRRRAAGPEPGEAVPVRPDGAGRSRSARPPWCASMPNRPEGSETTSNTTAALSGFGCANGTDGHEPDGAAATMTSPAPGRDRWSLARPTGRAVGGSPARSTLPADRPLLRVHRPPVVPAPARMTTRNACANIAKVMWRYQAS